MNVFELEASLTLDTSDILDKLGQVKQDLQDIEDKIDDINKKDLSGGNKNEGGGSGGESKSGSDDIGEKVKDAVEEKVDDTIEKIVSGAAGGAAKKLGGHALGGKLTNVLMTGGMIGTGLLAAGGIVGSIIDPETRARTWESVPKGMSQIASTDIGAAYRTMWSGRSLYDRYFGKKEEVEVDPTTAPGSANKLNHELSSMGLRVPVYPYLVGDMTGGSDTLTGASISLGAVPKRASGQSYVPYDGWTASLHRGEAILTANQAEAWRSNTGGSSEDIARAVASAVKTAMRGVTMSMDKTIVGAMVAGPVSEQIARSVMA